MSDVRFKLPTYIGGDLDGIPVAADAWNFREVAQQVTKGWEPEREDTDERWSRRVVEVQVYHRVTYQIGPGVIVDAFQLEGDGAHEIAGVIARLAQKGIAVLEGRAGSGVEDDAEPTHLFGYPAVLELIGTPGGPLRMNLPLTQGPFGDSKPVLEFGKVLERIRERQMSPGGRPSVR